MLIGYKDSYVNQRVFLLEQTFRFDSEILESSNCRVKD